jgi:hypothetical protein
MTSGDERRRIRQGSRWLVILLVVTPLGAAACGGGSSPSSSSKLRSAATTEGPILAFAVCMRSHGSSGFPDPQVSSSAGHGHVKISPGALDPNSSAFKAASAACHHLLPNGGSSHAAVSAHQRAQDVTFAACMRSHGVPSFPDPDHDGVFTLPAGTDQQAPQFQRATQACMKLEPSSLSLNQSPPGP